MELIVLILIIALVFANRGKKAGGRAAGGRAGQAAQVDASKAVAQARAAKAAAKARAAKTVKQAAAAPEAARRVEPVVQPQPQAAMGDSMLEDAECAGGSMEHTHAEGNSALEDADCVGGSMEHTHTEGVDRADHARRMAAIDAQATHDVLPEAIDARALRRAVVMAEVLGKPRALRRG